MRISGADPGCAIPDLTPLLIRKSVEPDPTREHGAGSQRLNQGLRDKPDVTTMRAAASAASGRGGDCSAKQCPRLPVVFVFAPGSGGKWRVRFP